VVAEARLEAQAVVGALERALAEEREEGKQRLHRLRLELTGSASEQLAAQQARAKEEPSPSPSPSPIPIPNPNLSPIPNLSPSPYPHQARAKEERIEAMHARAARRFDPKGQCWETWKVGGGAGTLLDLRLNPTPTPNP